MNRKQPARTDEMRAPEPSLPEPLTVNIAEAERITGLGHRTLYRELAAGRLQAVKRGRTTLIKMDSIRAYLASLPAATFRQERAA
jgi:excisionase family DNA binding protein